MKKWILRSILALVVLFIVAVVVIYFSINTLVRHGVTYGGKTATGQDTGLSDADLSFSSGSLKLNNLDISNPSDYSAPKFLVMKSCFTSVQTSSLFSSTVDVPQITIDGLEVTVEQNGMKNNLNDLLAVIQKNTSAATTTQNPSQSSSGKNLKIGDLKLTGTKVHVRGMVNLDLNLPDLDIKDPTNPDGRPMKIADLIGQILIHLAQQIVQNPQIPGDIKGAMKNATDILNNVGPMLNKNLKELPNLQNMTMPNMPNMQDTGKKLENLNPFKKN